MVNFSVFAIRSKFIFTVFVFIAFFLLFYLEFVTYWMLPWTWMQQENCETPHCKKLLLVADPQIIGPEWHGWFLMDVLAIWDSDRYLKRTFTKAVNYINPDIIIYLGDLMDQGYIASNEEFYTYVKRLNNIFKLPSSLNNVQVILSPGDNDIGGIEDILIPQNVQRFNKVFNQTDESILVDSIEFCKVNLMTTTMQQSKVITSDFVRVALSHAPLIRKETFFLKEVIKKIRPHLILSGHLHTSFHYTVYENDIYTFKHKQIPPSDTQPKMYKFHEGLVHEIIVPTCSYRMGVSNMGYGAAFIDTKKNVVHYNVLWLPRRFLQIFIYLVLMTPLVLVLAIKCLRRIRLHHRYKHSKNTAGSLL